MGYQLNVFSEIEPLETVMLKRPGEEINYLIPDMIEELLFDDIPYLPAMQEEHEAFVQVLEENGVEVLYLDELAIEAYKALDDKSAFVEKMLEESNLDSVKLKHHLREYFLDMDASQMIQKMIAGVNRSEVDFIPDHEQDGYPLFLMNPMPNMYFTRDVASVIGNKVSINNMMYEARSRETLFVELIMKKHPKFRLTDEEILVNRYEEDFNTEGGDIIVLSDKVVAIGVSQRTSLAGAKAIAQKLFSRNSQFEKVLAIEIPNVRAMMHLDTVFTMISHNVFTLHAGIFDLDGNMKIHVIEPGVNELQVSVQTDLAESLKEALGEKEIIIIPCGGGHEIDGPREQWNDGSNTLAIAPGKVVTYNRNAVTNALLRENGIEVLEIPSSELSRGRGGPRCMSMPISRKRMN
ncbi:arginine deiminase [Jeotgalibaca caeni]|uniref:arginine deiminase n=1 Tax=Jeotgalibaca caeni TaxID=3028623 RepID=UPI00237E9CD3|nr:arginine deiminase [Jeotgalibaca caeni]MDE1548364.1 arginine deiminase [Jeotgalibaca caeni]